MSYLLTESPFWGYEGYYTNWRNFVPTKDILLTPAQLSKFDGSDPNLPIYLSIDGNIYDVTLGRQWYGKGGSYNVFAGRDSSRAFATNCLSDESHFTYDLRDLTPEELKNLNGWKRFYGNHHTYHKVGKLVGFTLDKDRGTGRGGSVLKISLKDPVTGGKSNLRVHGNDPVEVLLLRQIEYQYLYSFENKVNLMNMSTFEELSLSQDMIEGGKNNLNLLTDGMPITVQSLEPEPGPISFRLPARYKYKIEKINRRTAQDKGTTYNPAFINDGKVEVKVPEFIDEGEEVIIDLATKEYVSRD
ncbi:Membrane-associated progesterone receptor component 1 [Zancudomyces culisetae]|uniref:Membrane-associated progesterone receptor component 1 n=1 Tax=Zancudomyces culisetae TaxID=1213189 RepID=A0A1R1PZ86_ZANCU|nr:Membrane-associated progesterone receptor component 1 [Zancudomyces culisetae]|eukprot:OMH86272.1 Membrane-associated progesterone receptor component 1 [Zancudomyces culisetae]